MNLCLCPSMLERLGMLGPCRASKNGRLARFCSSRAPKLQLQPSFSYNQTRQHSCIARDGQMERTRLIYIHSANQQRGTERRIMQQHADYIMKPPMHHLGFSRFSVKMERKHWQLKAETNCAEQMLIYIGKMHRSSRICVADGCNATLVVSTKSYFGPVDGLCEQSRAFPGQSATIWEIRTKTTTYVLVESWQWSFTSTQFFRLSVKQAISPKQAAQIPRSRFSLPYPRYLPGLSL